MFVKKDLANHQMVLLKGKLIIDPEKGFKTFLGECISTHPRVHFLTFQVNFLRHGKKNKLRVSSHFHSSFEKVILG